MQTLCMVVAKVVLTGVRILLWCCNALRLVIFHPRKAARAVKDSILWARNNI